MSKVVVGLVLPSRHILPAVKRPAALRETPPASPSGHRTAAFAMGRVNRRAPPRPGDVYRIRRTPPSVYGSLTLPVCRTILPVQPNCRIHKGKMRRCPEPTGTAS